MTRSSTAARYSALSKCRPANDPELVTAKRDLYAERIERAILEAASRAPELSRDQKERLAALILRGSIDASPDSSPSSTGL